MFVGYAYLFKDNFLSNIYKNRDVIALESLSDKLRAYFSTKLLDFAEALPKFHGGPIEYMQIIRERERKLSTQIYERSKQPDNTNIKLQSVTLLLCYEVEQYSLIHKCFRRACRNSKRMVEKIDCMSSREKRLFDGKWGELGIISGSSNIILSDIITNNLPSEIKYISISQHKILASLACLEFKIFVSESFQENIQRAAESFHMLSTISNSFLPHKLFKNHSMSYKNGADLAVHKCLQKFIKESSEWLARFLKINRAQLHICAAHPLYEIQYSTEENIKSHADSHREWLSKYGYVDNSVFSGYHSDDILYSLGKMDDTSLVKIEPLFVKKQNTEPSGLLRRLLLTEVLTSSVLRMRLDYYRYSIESLRSKGFMDLTEKWKVIRKSGKTVYNLKRVILRLKRMRAEFQQSKSWLGVSLSEGPTLITKSSDKELSFSSDTLNYIGDQLKSLSDSAIMLDQALSDWLSTENIYAMYRLQRRIIWLTIISVVIATLGLLSSWDNIQKGANAIYESHLLGAIKGWLCNTIIRRS